MRKLFALLLCLVFAQGAEAAPIGNPIAVISSTVAEGSHILKTSAGFLNGWSATSGATPGYILIFDSATVPADGTVSPKYCYEVPATSTTGASYLSYPAPFVNGIVIVFSSSGCFTKTVSASAFFTAQIQ